MLAEMLWGIINGHLCSIYTSLLLAMCPTHTDTFHWKMSGKWQETKPVGDFPLSHRLLGRQTQCSTKSCLSAGLCFHLEPHFYHLCVSGLHKILFEHGKLHPVLACITLCLPPASLLSSLKCCKKLSSLPCEGIKQTKINLSSVKAACF